MTAVKCDIHPSYRGLRKPNRTKANPGGCPKCLAYFHEHARDLVEANKPKPKPKNIESLIARVDPPIPKNVKSLIARADPGILDPAKLKIEQEPNTDEFCLLYGKHALFVAVNMNEIHAYLAGLNDGLARNVREEIGS